MKRQDFLGYTPSGLIDAASEAADAPLRQDGTVNRPALLKTIEVELKILFADLMQTLPCAADADLQEHSAAAKEFRNAMTRILTTPQTWETGQNGACQRASLISRAAAMSKFRSRANTKVWKRVLSAVNLWLRPGVSDDGEIVMLVAIRWELAHQIKIPLFGVVDQDSLVALGVRYGVIDPNPPVPTKTDHGNKRVAVLKREFIEPLLGDARVGADGPDEGVEDEK